jgi:hypothetical protein
VQSILNGKQARADRRPSVAATRPGLGLRRLDLPPASRDGSELARALAREIRAQPSEAASATTSVATDGAAAGCLHDWAALLIDADGTIRGGEGGIESLFGYCLAELDRRPISLLLPELPLTLCIKGCQFTPQFRYRCRIGCTYKVRRRNGDEYSAALFPSGIGNVLAPGLRLMVRPIGTEGPTHA